MTYNNENKNYELLIKEAMLKHDYRKVDELKKERDNKTEFFL